MNVSCCCTFVVVDLVLKSFFLFKTRPREFFVGGLVYITKKTSKFAWFCNKLKYLNVFCFFFMDGSLSLFFELDLGDFFVRDWSRF